MSIVPLPLPSGAEARTPLHAQPGAFVHCRSWLMHPFPQALPFLQTRQHCLEVSDVSTGRVTALLSRPWLPQGKRHEHTIRTIPARGINISLW
jgi:hypothetical protein